MRKIAFDAKAFEDYNYWEKIDPGIYEKIKDLIRDIYREPFKGIGKPEPLKGNYKGTVYKYNLEKKEMNPETREKLKNIFCNDVMKLQELIKRDLSSWLK
jgi:toxin YoeB